MAGANDRSGQRRRRTWRRGAVAVVGLCLLGGAFAPEALAHLADIWSHVDQTFELRVSRDAVEVRVELACQEFPGLSLRRAMDADEDRAISKEEQARYCEKVSGELAEQLVLLVDGRRVPLRPTRGSKVNLIGERRVVPCGTDQFSAFSASVRLAAGRPVRVSFETKIFPDNPGYFRYKLTAHGVTVLESSLPDEEPNPDPLAYGDAIEIRKVGFTCRVPETPVDQAATPAPPKESAGPAWGQRPARDTVRLGFRAFQKRVEAYFRGEFSFWAFVVLIVAAFVYGGIHALAPGHAKTITAAYLIGSQATPWHAVLLGVVVTVSHTWSIYALALVTHYVYGGNVPPHIHGIVMAVSGGLIAVLGLGQFIARLRHREFLGHHHDHDHFDHGHTHHHDHDHPHEAHHHHDHPHDHEHPAAEQRHEHAHEPRPHGHTRVHPTAAEGVTLKTLVFLGFSGGIVPCPGALWIYFLALSLHRTFEGIVLITALGAGLATVLTAVGLLTVRLRRSAVLHAAGGELRLAQRLPGLHGRVGAVLDRALVWVGRRLSLIGPCIIAALGVVLVVWGLLSAGVLGRG